jgi:hypothetical protein
MTSSKGLKPMKIKLTREVLTKSKGNLNHSPFSLAELPDNEKLLETLEKSLLEISIKTSIANSNKGDKNDETTH